MPARSLAGYSSRLAALGRNHRLRALEALASPQGPEIDIGGERLVNFCSNDYLGLANHPQVRRALQEGADRYGVGAGAAALLSGRSEAHAALERALAIHLQRDAALIFSSGYLANLGILSALAGRHDVVFHDRLNHASLIDAVRLCGAKHHRYPHGDDGALAGALAGAGAASKWVVTDGIFSMDGDLAPLPRLAAHCAAQDACLICDDAHGYGVLGDGRGTASHYGLTQDDVPLLMVTFGKALGTAGAAVAGPAVLIETLIQAARTFIYDTAPPPALATATHAALELSASDGRFRARLFANIRYFHARLRAHGLPVPASGTPIQPIIIGEDAAALAHAAALRQRGIYVRAVRPPTVPAGTARLRICLSAAHSEAQIDRLVAALAALPLDRAATS